MSKVSEAITEIDAALADMAPKLEGLQDYALLDLKPDTLAEVNEAIGLYTERKTKLETARAACEALVLDDGYPALVIPDVSVSVLADLQENADTIAAALSQFHANPATTIAFTAAPPEPKQ